MEKKIEFDLTGKLILNNESCLKDIVATLQKFTKTHLYIDNEDTLKGVNDIQNIDYLPCKLVSVDHQGYNMEEVSTGKTITVFNYRLMDFLYYKNIIENDEDTTESFAESAENEDTTESFAESAELCSLEIYDTSEKSSECSDNKYFYIFRIFLNLNDGMDPVCLNKKDVEILKDNIDIESTINLSFSSYLENLGYENTISLKYESSYAEIEIVTQKPLNDETVEEIEDEAQLTLDNDDIIFFILREKYEENFNEEINKIIEASDDLIIYDQIYDDGEIFSSEVPLFKLPDQMSKEIMDRIDYLNDEGDSFIFSYNDSEFEVKSEKEGLFSVFDLEDYFDNIPHLHPNYYDESDGCEYYELPICQFHYFNK